MPFKRNDPHCDRISAGALQDDKLSGLVERCDLRFWIVEDALEG